MHQSRFNADAAALYYAVEALINFADRRREELINFAEHRCEEREDVMPDLIEARWRCRLDKEISRLCAATGIEFPDVVLEARDGNRPPRIELSDKETNEIDYTIRYGIWVESMREVQRAAEKLSGRNLFSPGVPDTTPDCRLLYTESVQAAKRDIPPLMNRMENEPGEERPPSGQRVVNAEKLLHKLRGEPHHDDAARWAIHELIRDGLLEALGAKRNSLLVMQDEFPKMPPRYAAWESGGREPLRHVVVRTTERLWSWRRSQPVPGVGAAAGSGRPIGAAVPGQGGAGDGEGVGPKKRKGGKPPLERQAPLKFQVYQRIKREHEAGVKRAEIVTRLKSDKDFVEQVREAGLKLNADLVKNALAYFHSRKKQETTSP